MSFLFLIIVTFFTTAEAWDSTDDKDVKKPSSWSRHHFPNEKKALGHIFEGVRNSPLPVSSVDALARSVTLSLAWVVYFQTVFQAGIAHRRNLFEVCLWVL
jgi:hypothetical protein